MADCANQHPSDHVQPYINHGKSEDWTFDLAVMLVGEIGHKYYSKYGQTLLNNWLTL